MTRIQEPDLYQGHGKRESYTISDYVGLTIRTYQVYIQFIQLHFQIPEVGGVFDKFEDAGVLSDNQTYIGGPTVCCSWYVFVSHELPTLTEFIKGS